MKTTQIKANVAGNSRLEVLEKRECAVFPVVMLTEGVHCGSLGCVFYSKDELSKFPSAWDHKPVVVRHPMAANGDPLSACTPAVANTTKVGTIFNTHVEDGKLKAEAWVYKDVCQATFPQLWTALRTNQMQEVSTGLFFDVEESPGKWGAEEYTLLARNLRPDHLAILPDDVGACSIADGAGIPRVNKQEDKPTETKPNLLLRLNQDPSFQALTEAVNKALSEGPFKQDPYSFWIEDVFLDRVVFGTTVSNSPRKYMQQSFSYTENPVVVTLEGEPFEVQRSVNYIPLEDAPTDNVENKRMKTEDGKAYPAEAFAYVPDPEKPSTWKLRMWDENGLSKKILGAAAAAFSPGGFRGNRVQLPKSAVSKVKAKLRAAYKKLGVKDEDIPDSIKVNIQTNMEIEKMAEENVDKEAEETSPKTVEEFVDSAPEGIKEELSDALSSVKARKAELVTAVLSKETNPFTKEDLERQPLSTLEKLVVLATPKVESKKEESTTNFAAAGGVTTASTKQKVEPLLPPVMNWDKK